MHTRPRIELLGGLRINGGDRIITRFRTQKTGALLAYLAYYRERSHPRELLIDLLWPEADLASGRNGLSIALSSLRHQLEPPGVPHGAILRADRFSVQLNPDAVATDVLEFETALQKATQAGSANERILFLADAVALYGGELLPGYYEEWCLAERERVAETYQGALQQLVGLLERNGDLDRALGYARRAVSADPLREEGYQDLIRLLAAAGQPTAALRKYRELEQRLDEQLGEEPSAATRRLAREIERQTAGETATKRPTAGARAEATPGSSTMPSRLPTGTVTFLLTDMEGSTARWERGGEAFTAALASHHSLLRRTFRRYGGYEVTEAGDGFLVAFERAGEALACAAAAQRALAEHPWPEEVGPLPVRMALHTGDVELQEGDYHGLVLHHASRMLAAGHGGQILCSETTAVVAQRQLEPGTRLTDLGVYRLRDIETPERLFQVEYPDMGRRLFSPLRAEAGYANSLPLQFTRFVGRERELGQLQELLLAEQTRLVTLTGPGGTGKSRLALELASRLLERFSGAIWFVSLADLTDPRLILDAVLEALRLPRSPSMEPLDQVTELLSRQPSLLVLDNFEQLVEQGASVVQTLLERVPTLRCLVTSRQRLGLSGEREFVVPPLQTPAGADTPEQLSMYESVQLFIDRAQAVKPDFQVTNQNAAAVAELCNRLEGSPLAIELAAARAQVLTPQQMLQQLSHRFNFLVSRRRDGAKRHQTLRAAVDWSYRLLPPELQRFFARLSVFRGGWSLEAAEAVCQEPMALDYLAQLRECSLVGAEEDAEEIRFRMLETLREFAQVCLEASDETAALRRQHAEFYLALVEEAGPHLTDGDGGEWMERLEREHDNLRSALAWLIESGGTEAGLRLAVALWPFWHMRGYWAEGRQQLAWLLALPEASEATATRMKLGEGAGRLAEAQGDLEMARALYEESLSISGELDDKHGVTRLLNRLGWITQRQGNFEAARELYEQSLAMSRKHSNRRGIVDSLHHLGNLLQDQGEYGVARTHHEEGLAAQRELGDKKQIARSLLHLGNVIGLAGNWTAARALDEQSVALFREIGDQRGISDSLQNLAGKAVEQGDYRAAHAFLQEVLAIRRRLGDRPGMAECLDAVAGVAWCQNNPSEAQTLFEQSLAVYRELGDRDGIAMMLGRLSAVAQRQGDCNRARTLAEESLSISQQIGDKFFIASSLGHLGDIAREEGEYEAARQFLEESLAIYREMDYKPSIAILLNHLGRVACNQGDYAAARTHHIESLAIYRELGEHKGVAQCLVRLAAAAIAESQWERAARLVGAAEALREATDSEIWSSHYYTDYELCTAAIRTAYDEGLLAATLAVGRAMSLQQAIAYALENGDTPAS
jgi:predicted ATPase/DNA-binding SARP family transcriptional activator